jgi:pre-mRNA-splicing factor RBM22/SLT11
MSHLGHQYRKGGGDEEFPILCETCLGDNPFIRMTKQKWGKACKICERPFTIYRWQPGSKARFKKTELCHTCAKLKNVCQTCVLDLEYGLPVQVRDSALEEHERMRIPTSDTNREYLIEQYEREDGGLANSLGYGKTTPSTLLNRLARRTPYYKRNLPHLCSFFARGACTRGALCPYRHEMPITGELANQNIKDRYFGQNDPVAKKLMRRAEASQPKLEAPEDKTITTLWVGGLDFKIQEADLRTKFAAHGTISSITLLEEKGCAFITYLHRASAEEAATTLVNNLVIKGKNLRLAWGRKAESKSSVPPPPGMTSSAKSKAPPPPGMEPASDEPVYPSQDPRQLAAKLPT